jgi:hypothetical protein
VAAPIVYLLAGFFMFGLPVLERGGYMVGVGTDPQIFIWALAWWPHALLHGGDPLYSSAIYYPQGLDLAHGAMIPAAGVLLWPVTALLGPIGSYNVAMVLCPVLAATFGFLLFRRITGSFWAALVGGWLFGFSPYMLGQMAGHLHLTLVFLVPAIVHLALRAYANDAPRTWLVWLLVVALTIQFYIAAEVFVSLTIFGAVAFVAAFVLGDDSQRRRLRELGKTLVIAYAVTAVLSAPYLYEAFKPGEVPVLPARSDIVSADLLSYVLPSTLTLLGGSTFASTTAHFTEGGFEGGAYLGLPLIAMAVLGIVRGWRKLGVRVALVTLVVVVICSFGGHLHIRGAFTIPMPWAFVNDLPVLGQLLPARFSDYVFLIVALLAAVWLAQARTLLLAVALAALAVVFAWPALSTGPWKSPTGVPPLFATNAYKRYVRPTDSVLILPIAGTGPSMLWQAMADFRFPIDGGYALPPEAPNPYSLDPLYPDLQGLPAANAGPATISFLTRHAVSVILMEPGAPTTAPWETFLEHLGWHGAVHGGVLIMRHTS